MDLSPQEVAQVSPPPQALQQPTWSNPTPPPVPKPTSSTHPAPPPWQAAPPTPPTPPVQATPAQPTQTPGWQNVAATELPTATNPAPPPWQATPPTPPIPPRTHPIQEQPTPSLPPPIASNRPQNNVPPLPVPTPATVPSAGAAPEQPAWSNPVSPPQPNFAIGAGNQSVAPPPMPNTTSPNSGGINKWVLIGGAGVGLLLLVIAVLVWQLLSNDGDKVNNAEIAVETIDVEKIEPEEIEEVEEREEAEPAEEPAEEIKDTTPEPQPKPKVIKQSSKPAPKSTRTSTKKASSKKTSKPQKSTTKSTPAPTTVGVGEFTVTISFQKEATLECGDGQTKDFVRQTKMTFTTPTACRISTEEGERGALTARKSGTMTCTLAGSRIRCK